MINSANRGSGVSCYRVKTENNDSRATIRSDRSCVSRIMFRRLCDVGGKGEGRGGLAGSLNRAEVDLSSKVSRRCRVKRTVYFRTSLLDRADSCRDIVIQAGEQEGGKNFRAIKAFL